MAKQRFPEYIWKKAEANQVMRDVRRMIGNGVIRLSSEPNILVKTDNGWKFPAISIR